MSKKMSQLKNSTSWTAITDCFKSVSKFVAFLGVDPEQKISKPMDQLKVIKEDLDLGLL